MNTQTKIAQIEAIVKSWSSNLDLVSEGQALRFSQQVEEGKDTSSKIATLKGQLFAFIAYARFNRIQHVDSILLGWLDKAMETNPHDLLINEVYIKIYLKQLQTPILPKQFPQIRETDHGNAKKKLAADYLEMANQFFDKVSELEKIIDTLIHAARRLYDDEQIINYEKLQDIIQALKKPLRQIVKSTEAYANSVSGIYYSQAQLAEVKKSIAEIEQLHNNWLDVLGLNKSAQQSRETNDALTELQKMIGLTEVKSRVEKLYHYLLYQKIRKEKGYQLRDELSLHMILTGNPGTGKTTLARLLAKIYHHLGLLPREEVIEVDRSHLVGGYVGQTEENTIKVIKEAQGGVLFIDEAYSLKRDGTNGNDFGQTSIDTLVSAMTSQEYAGKFAVILAGYPEEMRQFLWANPGLRSRFPESNHIHLQDYTLDELLEIAELIAIENDFTFSESAMVELQKRIENEQVDASFGNARTVKNIVLDAIFEKGSQFQEEHIEAVDFTILEAKDLTKEPNTPKEVSGINQLQHLIGLNEIKEEVAALISFVKVQQLRRENNLPAVPILLHSVYTGNPGTGKTTVATIYAKILKELGLLKRGHLVVAGRSDLVAGYTGQTALQTKKKIREALGGVLFIDEAYSLLGRDGDFGREAITTLVEEMTKHDDRLVVILAGYEQEIKLLIESNPGLNSRFKKFYQFRDYTADQLVELVRLNTYQLGYTWKEDVNEFLQERLTQLSPKGNGRYAKDLVDLAIQQHSYRIMNEEIEWSTNQLTQLSMVDFKKILDGGK